MTIRSLICLIALTVLPALARAELKTEEVRYEHDGVTLLGYLAYDNAFDGPRPGVLVIHEWRGHDAYARSRAEQLAKLGYTAFALDMYGEGVLARNNEEAGQLAARFYNDRDLARARAQAGLKVLTSHAKCDASRTAAIGYCFGGTMVLELARAGTDLDAVVSFHGGLATTKPAQKGAVKAQILICNGYADPLVSMEDRAAVKKELTDAGAVFTYIDYSGAVHGFTNPNNGPANGRPVGYDQRADHQSWQHMRTLFAQTLE